jgi:molybdopterin/thiamine biosynthesis adenylyltransferase/rhodanese-related sulfurtransferase
MTGEVFSSEERARYARHLILPEVGEAGQARLRAASVLIVGMGGLGCPLAMYLAAAGVGRLGLVDGDRVDAGNLQRQVLYATEDVGRLKAEAAAERLRGINPLIAIEPHAVMLDAGNARDLFVRYDVIVDGTDNFATRYLVNDACVMLGKPNVHGSIFRFEGQLAVFDARRGPCYRCLYPSAPQGDAVPNCAEAGVLGVLPGLLGTMQAAETLKLLLGIGEPLVGRVLHVDTLGMRTTELKLRKDPQCPVCGKKPTITELKMEQAACAAGPEITAQELKARLAGEGSAGLVLIDVREPHEHAERRIERARLIPLGTLQGALAELDKGAEIVVHCKSGRRSAQAQALLREAGFEHVVNLAGGIDAWEG